ncbi:MULTISPECIES: hypothetical protein [unclassified Novosphingobium]|uniref:hypothetical protein n=1 Tax=unclassified Novosphingobium TaxID=2644732 RepID=UPI000D322001|nr:MULTISPECIES: hypothetical protein [unclassified Novosphingobium]PTR08916.1 hypothetical protein C8K11_110179 [Novosphingobium sp. GV055]PUB01828.1 hypothetical protein C8K12_110179 [Novosphingobium sp. GV061]PUB17800.1 hypothetical protein C8K14_110179 [Novosphingobium sp. GV079]PUB40494.1 hypothetical protein C8K10_110179 [Novosphingobium sp. GV027]
MIDQGSVTINTAYIDRLIDRINAAKNPVDLQARVDEAFAPVAAQLAHVRELIERLAPWLALLEAPIADPTKIVSWIKDMILAQVQPQVQAYYKAVAQVAALSAKVAELESAAQAAAHRFSHVPITVPEISL